jgi:hypothetical protein
MRFGRRLCSRGVFAVRPGARQMLLLVAILPSFTFLGHWGLQFDVPGTDDYVVLVPGASHEDQHEVGQHENHCHLNAATCTDIPFTGASPFALLHASVAYLGATALLLAFALNAWRPSSGATVDPDLRPPRGGWTKNDIAPAAALA